jgi:hypothetical protein
MTKYRQSEEVCLEGIDLRIGHYLYSDDPTSYASLYNYPNIGIGVNWKGSSCYMIAINNNE